MGYRVLAIVMVTFLVTGFGWGKKQDEDAEKKSKTSYVAPQVNASGVANGGFATGASVNSSQAKQTSVTGQEAFPTELISTIASGDEETRRARIESLKRLSQALSEMKKDDGQAVSSATSQSSTNAGTQSNSTYPWGNY